jgi:HTH-type transcriptional regulator / antitoxin HigA
MIDPVVDRASHEKALRRIERLWEAKAGSREKRELDALATLVDAYERRAFPIQSLNAADAIKLRCEALGWTRRELEPLIGSRARVSEVLSGRRALTLAMIRRLNRALGIPAEILISDSRETSQPATGLARKSRGKGRGGALARVARRPVSPGACR